MGILNIFKGGKSYKSSPHCAVYEKIAEANETEPEYVYKLAHGKTPKTHADAMILQDLHYEGIIK